MALLPALICGCGGGSDDGAAGRPEVVAAERRAASEASSPDALLEQAAEATGKEYFALKARLLASESALAFARQRKDDPAAPPQERLTALALCEQADDRDGFRGGLLLVCKLARGTGPMPMVPARVEWNLYNENPTWLTDRSIARRMLSQLSEHPGVLFEVLAKHTPETVLPVVGETRFHKLQHYFDLPENEGETKTVDAPEGIMHIAGSDREFDFDRFVWRLNDTNGASNAQEWVKSLADYDRHRAWSDVRRLAIRALILHREKVAVDILRAFIDRHLAWYAREGASSGAPAYASFLLPWERSREGYGMAGPAPGPMPPSIRGVAESTRLEIDAAILAINALPIIGSDDAKEALKAMLRADSPTVAPFAKDALENFQLQPQRSEAEFPRAHVAWPMPWGPKPDEEPEVDPFLPSLEDWTRPD